MRFRSISLISVTYFIAAVHRYLNVLRNNEPQIIPESNSRAFAAHYTKSGKFAALLFHGLCPLGKIDWASESHQELNRCLSSAITASKNFND